MKRINKYLNYSILWLFIFLGACVSPGGVKEVAPEKIATENVETEVDVLSVVHFDDQEVGFEIREPSTGIDPDSQAQFNQAILALQGEHFSAAIELLQEIIGRNPDYANPHINIALAYRQLGMEQEVEDHLLAALALIPHHPVASNEYALFQKSKGNFQEARSIFEESIAQYPEYIPLHRNLGILCDVYFNDQLCAQEHFEACQHLLGEDDDEITMWLTELKHRSHE